jgi:hypothetical protein
MIISKGWTDSQTILDESKDVLTNFEWDSFSANYGNKNLVPKLPGLYIFSSHIHTPFDNSHFTFRHPFYIGMSSDSIESRYRCHIIRPEWKRMTAAYGKKFTYSFKILENYSYQDLLTLEDKLIRTFNPVLNISNSKSREKSDSA